MMVLVEVMVSMMMMTYCWGWCGCPRPGWSPGPSLSCPDCPPAAAWPSHPRPGWCQTRAWTQRKYFWDCIKDKYRKILIFLMKCCMKQCEDVKLVPNMIPKRSILYDLKCVNQMSNIFDLMKYFPSAAICDKYFNEGPMCSLILLPGWALWRKSYGRAWSYIPTLPRPR